MSDPVTTNDDRQEPDEVLAQTITPADVGESPLAPPPRRRAQQAQPVQPSVDAVRLRARLEKIIGGPLGSGDTGEEHPIPGSDHPEDRRAEIARLAWTNSLTACDVADLAGHRLNTLHPTEQHGRALTIYAGTLRAPKFRNLVLAGRVGSGKTSAAVALGWAAIEAGLSARFIEHSKYLLWLRPDQMPTTGPYADVTPHQLRARMRTCDLLVVDDLGASLDPTAPVTQYVKDETLTLIGDRMDTPGRITVVTTNLKPDALTKMFGEQFLSRLSKNGHAISFLGEDRRGRLTW